MRFYSIILLIQHNNSIYFNYQLDSEYGDPKQI